MTRNLRTLALTATVFMPALAFAHAGHAEHAGFAAGFAHPFDGADHLLALIAVGVLAARLFGRAKVILVGAIIALAASFAFFHGFAFGERALNDSAGVAFITGVATASTLVLALAVTATRALWPVTTSTARH